MFVSPTEPPQLKALGRSTWFPEKFGCDVLTAFAGNFHGVQRKELSDLLASLHDGRLAKEMGQMNRLATALLIVEGRPTWTLDGTLMNNHHSTQWTRTQHRNLLRSVQSRGIWVETTESLTETCEAVLDFDAYIRKGDHSSLSRRPGPISVWGRADSRDYQSHFIQGLPGVGATLADNILEHFGKMPIGWTVGEKELQQVAGIGKKKAKQLFEALGTGLA